MTSDGYSGAPAWKVLTAISALLAVGATVCAYTLNSDKQDLTAQLKAAQMEEQTAKQASATLQSQLTALQNQVSGQQQQLESQQAQLASESRPDLPIRVGFRRALIGQGEVGTFLNLSNQVLQVTLDVTSPATGASLHRVLTMNPHGFVQIGPIQQWPFAPGQKLELSNPSFRSVTRMVPG